MTDRLPFRVVFCTLCLAGALGGAGYALSGSVGGLPLLLTARVVGGLALGCSTAAQSYAVYTLPVEERSPYLALLSAASFIGVFAGPLVTPSFGLFHAQLGALAFDAYTMPGWFLFAAFLVLLVLLMLVLVEPARQVSHPGISLPSTADLASLTPRALADAKAVASDAARTPPLVAAGLCLCLLTQPVFSIDLYSFIPTLAPHTEAHFGWGPTANSILFFSFAFGEPAETRTQHAWPRRAACTACSPEVNVARAHADHQTSRSRLQVAGRRPQAAGCRLQAAGCLSDSRLQAANQAAAPPIY